MWSPSSISGFRIVPIALTCGFLAACTVEPLNRSVSDSAIASGSQSASVTAALAGSEVAPVDTRSAQQVRNALLFAINGGRSVEPGPYKINLTVTTTSQNVSVQSSVRAPTSAQLRLEAGYSMIEKTTGKVVTSGERTTIAGYELTPQNFANQRALRDAEDRAAKEVAQQIRLALLQALAGQ